MRYRRVLNSLAATAAAALWLAGAGASYAQEGGGAGRPAASGRMVSPDERLEDILGPPASGEAGAGSGAAGASSRNRERGDPSVLAVFLKMIGWTAVVVAAGAAIAIVLRRYTALGRRIDGGGAVRVVARTALSPKHSIFLVRLGNQRLLAVGVSGDRMVTLSEIEDPAGILACDGEFRSALESYEQDGSGGSPPPGSRPDLLPYREEIRRARGILGNWRGLFGRAGAAGTPAVGAVRMDSGSDASEGGPRLGKEARGETLGA